MFDEEYYLWFTKSNFVKILKIDEAEVKHTGHNIDVSLHMNRGEKPICVSTNFAEGWLIILYESFSDDVNWINQVMIFARNIFEDTEIRLIDPQRICYKSKPPLNQCRRFRPWR